MNRTKGHFSVSPKRGNSRRIKYPILKKTPGFQKFQIQKSHYLIPGIFVIVIKPTESVCNSFSILNRPLRFVVVADFMLSSRPLFLSLMQQHQQQQQQQQLHGWTTLVGNCRRLTWTKRRAVSVFALYCSRGIPCSLFSPFPRPLFESAHGFSYSTTLHGLQRGQRYHCQVASQLIMYQNQHLDVSQKRSLQHLFSTLPSSADRSTRTSADPSSSLFDTTRHLPRLYVETSPQSLTKGVLVPITTAQSHYLLDVMRITNPKRWQNYASHVRIFNGYDGEWLAKVVVTADTSKPSRRQRKSGHGQDEGLEAGTMLECVECLISQPSNKNSYHVPVHLFMGQLKKRQQLKWVMEKVTELGVDEITLVDTEYSVGSGNSDPWDHEKHMSHLVEAAEQCERLTLPVLSLEPKSWKNLMEEMRASHKDSGVMTYWFVCRERSVSSPPLLSVLLNLLEEHCSRESNDMLGMRFNVLVGPEGGWSPQELDAFANIMMSTDEHVENHQIQFVSLGSLVLRAETAAMTAVAVLQMYLQLEQQNKKCGKQQICT
jgi:16S rRNA (uracil1498-N3)-methyltransferase